MEKKNIDRRQFLSYSAALGAAGLVGTTLLTSCGGNKPLRKQGTYYVPDLKDFADDGRELKVGLVGCGGRGTGALTENLMYIDRNVKVTALGDVLADRAEEVRYILAAGNEGMNIAPQEVPSENIFIGFDAYKKVIDSGVDMVILATPPAFRPIQFAYAVEKGVHAFLEKPVAVDPKGYRTIMAAAKLAKAKGLSVVTGTQRRHQREYVEAFKLIQDGMIGQITGGNVYWNQEQLWYRDRQPEWSDMEYMIRDWVNWPWLSGDCITEQHVHNIDVFMWFSGLKPVSATSFGCNQRRPTGNGYDMFSTDFDFGNGIHVHSMSRQINGCSNNVSEMVIGTKGYWCSDQNAIFDLSGKMLWQYSQDPNDPEKQNGPYMLEHVDWVNHIRRGEGHVEAEETAEASLAAIMAREAAYTGKTITWDEISASDLDMVPENPVMGPVDMSKFVTPIPGK